MIITGNVFFDDKEGWKSGVWKQQRFQTIWWLHKPKELVTS